MAKILVVDDETAIQLLIKAVLKEHEVTLGSDGDEALEIIEKQGYPDLVMLDIMMPGGLDGIELCEKIRQEKSLIEVPIIMLSALETHHDIVDAIETGANDYLIKPFNNLELKARVNSLLKLKVEMKNQLKKLLKIFETEGWNGLLKELD